MENKSKSCSTSCCWTKCIAILALSISLFCLGILVGQCMSNCSSKKSKCKTKSEKCYKKCGKSYSYSGCTYNYDKKDKKCSKKLNENVNEQESELIEE